MKTTDRHTCSRVIEWCHELVRPEVTNRLLHSSRSSSSKWQPKQPWPARCYRNRRLEHGKIDALLLASRKSRRCSRPRLLICNNQKYGWRLSTWRTDMDAASVACLCPNPKRKHACFSPWGGWLAYKPSLVLLQCLLLALYLHASTREAALQPVRRNSRQSKETFVQMLTHSHTCSVHFENKG